MRFLLDTCVVSEFSKAVPDAGVAERLARFSHDDAGLSVITIGELSKGINLLKSGRQKTGLKIWFEQLQRSYAEYLLPVDTNTAEIWGDLTARAQRRGRQIAAADGLIAATAIQHNLTLLTRNDKDFSLTGASVENPWA